ncbi:MAG: metallophosphoesterase [Rhodobacteraceae bacterium]|nr:metallophosphoesterase [Paracoccaceae bacterium]
MTRFLHLTDIHLSAGTNHEAKAALLGRIAGAIPTLRHAPDFVVMSGDLVDRGDRESYAALRPLIEAFPVPVVLALGNHDRRASFHDVFGRAGSESSHDHDIVLGGVHVVTLDTSVPGRVAGALDEAQVEWLADAMARHPDLPKLIVAHHPPKTDENALPWTCLDDGSTARLASLIEVHPVLGILSGHIHMNRMSLWRGVPLVVSAGLHSTIDVLHEDGLRIVEGAGFGLCRVEEGNLSVHFVPLLPEGREVGMIDAARLRAFA